MAPISGRPSAAHPHLYIASAEADLREQLRLLLVPMKLTIGVHDSAPSLLAGVAWNLPGCALIDSALPHPHGIVDLLERLRRLAPEVMVLMTAEPGDVTTAVDALRAGAFDLIETPIAETTLRRRVDEIMAALRRP